MKLHWKSIFDSYSDELLFRDVYKDFIKSISFRKTVLKVDIVDLVDRNELIVTVIKRLKLKYQNSLIRKLWPK